MANKMYVKDGMNFEGISMQEGKSSSTLKLLVFMVVTAVFLGLLIFTAANFFNGNNNTEQDDSPRITILPTSSRMEPTNTPVPSPTDRITPTPSVKKTTPTVTKSPTPTDTVSAGLLTLEILNGSGTRGAAAKMSSTLTSAGYTIERTGNADTFTHEGITVNIKKSKSQQLNQLKKDLSSGGYLVTSSGTTLAESSSADAVIIIGAEQ